MSSSDTSEDFDSYLHRLDEAEESAFQARRRPALADPLEKGVVLPWNGPNLHPSTLPPVNYPYNTPPAVGLGGPSASSSPCSTAYNWSQIWRCEVVDVRGGERGVETVVLQLRQETLFPIPRGWTSCERKKYWEWWSSDELVRCESKAYERLRGYQGRDVPICYGSYSFALPCGENVVGVVLEDLSRETISLGDFFVREVSGERLRPEKVVSLATQAFLHQFRLQNCHVLNTWLDAFDILIPRSTLEESAVPIYIALGFGGTVSLEKVLRSHERHMKELEETGKEDHDPTWTWQRGEQLRIEAEFDRILESTGGFERSQCGELPFFVDLD